MDENTIKQDEAPPVTLQPRQASNPIVSMAKKLGLKTLAWIGVYMLGYFDFSVAWMITPLLLSVMRDQWKKDKRNKLTAAREAALSNEQAMIEARMNVDDLPSWVFFPDTNISRKEIIMDLDIVFASDLEIVFKVKGIPARVSDFGLRGMARVVFKPLISQIPLIGGVQVYFLKAPDIDYTLGGVAGTLEIPGLSKIVERIIIEQVMQKYVSNI